jgi:hypothetical protein
VLAATALITSGCQDEQPTAVSPKASEPQRALLEAMVDTFVPRDQDPGAVEAGVPDILLETFADNRRLAVHGEALMKRLEAIAREQEGKPFALLGIDAREQILNKIYRSRDEVNRAARDAVLWMRVEILSAFYLTPVGQAVLGYHPPYPRGYPEYAAPPGQA